MFESITCKFGKMRKPQKFTMGMTTIVGTGKRVVTLQSDKTIGQYDLETRQFVFTNKGCYFYHLSMYAQLTEIPEELKADIESKAKNLIVRRRVTSGN